MTYSRWNSVSNDELLPPQNEVYDRHYSTSSQYLMPNTVRNPNDIMMVHPKRGKYQRLFGLYQRPYFAVNTNQGI